MSNLILDTCGLIWLVNKGGELSKHTLISIQKAEIVYVSAATALEIGCKVALGKLELPMHPNDWYSEAIEQHDIVEIAIDGQTGLQSASLPMIHKDPADRIIIATAKLKNLPVVTHDRRFEEYGVKVLK